MFNKLNIPKASLQTYDRSLRGTANDAVRNSLKMKEYENKDIAENLISESFQNTLSNEIVDGKIKAMNKFKNKVQMDETVKRVLLERTIGEVFYKAIPLDESFKCNYKENLICEFNTKLCESLNTNDITVIYNKLEKISNPLQVLVEACRTKSKELKEESNKQEDSDNIDKLLYPLDEEDDLDIKEDFDIEKLSDSIKEKVVEVVAQETEDEEKRKEMMDEITGTKELNESVKLYKSHRVEENTLFKSMMIGNYKKSIKELNESTQSTLYATKTEDSVDVNMDMILAESIINYTLLETLYSLKIINLDNEGTRMLSESLVYNI